MANECFHPTASITVEEIKSKVWFKAETHTYTHNLVLSGETAGTFGQVTTNDE